MKTCVEHGTPLTGDGRCFWCAVENGEIPEPKGIPNPRLTAESVGEPPRAEPPTFPQHIAQDGTGQKKCPKCYEVYDYTTTHVCEAGSPYSALLQLVQKQAEDKGLWFVAQTAPEAYLQQELRKLHAAVEYYSPSAPAPTWTCKARAANMGANDPQECNWPLCGCDPYADKVIAALEEHGLLRNSWPDRRTGEPNMRGEGVNR